MALAEDKRPEANTAHNFWVSMDRNPRGCHNLRWQSIGGSPSKSLTQCRIAKLVWWGINNFKLLLYCDKALIVSYDVRRSNYWTNDKQDVILEVTSCHKLSLISYMMMASYEERNAFKPIMHEHDNLKGTHGEDRDRIPRTLSSKTIVMVIGSSGQTWACERL